MSYKKPTLFEIYLRLHFAEGVLPQSRFFDVVPMLKNRGLTSIELTQAVHLEPEQLPLTPRVRCWDEEKLRLVQLDRDTVIINQTKKYLGWSNFTQLITNTLEALTAANVELRYRSAVLHTFDRFSVPREGYRFGDWLHTDGPMIPRWYEDSTATCDIDLGLGLLAVDGKNRQLHLHVRPRKDDVEIRFDAVFENEIKDAGTLDRALGILHEESNACFEAIITDRVRTDIMGGNVSE